MNDVLIDSFEYSKTLASFLSSLNIPVFNYVEFGTYNGTSLVVANEIFKFLKYDDVNYYAFDSFKGLPNLTEEDDQDTFKEGLYACSKDELFKNLTKNKFPINKLKIYEGFYSDVFKTINKNELPKFDILMLDCDLYSSTNEALNFCVDLISDSAIIIFDDWHSSVHNKGQSRAFKEFLEKVKNFKIVYNINYKYFGRLAGEIFNIKKV